MKAEASAALGDRPTKIILPLLAKRGEGRGEESKSACLPAPPVTFNLWLPRQMNCTYVHLDKTNGKQSPCCRPVFGNGKFCVFHSPDTEGRRIAFSPALSEMLGQASASGQPVDLDFKGFIFPRVDFRKYIFRGLADFRAAIFTDDVDFRGAVFYAAADFHTAEFRGNAGFFAVVFSSSVRVLGVAFQRRAIFNGCKFRGSTAFHGCKFGDFASWQASKFDKPVVFESNEFVRDGDLRQAVFFGGVDFYQTLFHRRVDFEGARFHGEVQFSESHIGFLKNPSSLGGLRCILNRGRVNCVEHAGAKDFDGDAIIECSRIDQPMKAYLHEHTIAGNQTWCTETFKVDIENCSSNLRFTSLPAIQLDKNYEVKINLFQITVA
jgi:uncharacterized protein YjbI with pentapeptide repeats